MRLKRYLVPTAMLAVLALVLVLAPDALAQKNFGLDTAAGSSIPKTKDLASVIGRIIGFILLFVGTLFLILMLYAGFLYMTARGDSKKVDQAKQLIVSAIIGLIIISSSYAITAWVLTAATGENLVTDGTGGGDDAASDEDIEIEIVCSAEDTCPASEGTCQNIDPETGEGVCVK